MTSAGRDGFGHDTTTDDVLKGIDLKGKKVLITGGASGLGKESARAMAARGAEIILAVRTPRQGIDTVAELIARTGNPAISWEQVDLGSLASIRAFAERFNTAHDRLDVLLNNAGVMACPFAKTEDGFEMQFGVNHVGHFLLTNLIAPALVKGAPSRIVNLSSRGHQIAPVDFEDPNFGSRPYHNWLSYGQSKTANVLFTVELERRLGPKGVHAYAVHPGVIQTNLGRHMTEEDVAFIQKRASRAAADTGMAYKTIP